MAKNRVFVLYCLSNRWQRTKICDNFSSWAELLQGVPESSVLEPLGTIKKLLELTIGRNLNFDDHVFSLSKKAGRKLSALSRISNYMSFEKKKNSFKSICGITVWVLPINLDVL